MTEATERITSKSNLWADLGSRARFGELRRQAEELGLRVRRVAVPSEWREAVAREAEAARAAALLEVTRKQGPFRVISGPRTLFSSEKWLFRSIISVRLLPI